MVVERGAGVRVESPSGRRDMARMCERDAPVRKRGERLRVVVVEGICEVHLVPRLARGDAESARCFGGQRPAGVGARVRVRRAVGLRVGEPRENGERPNAAPLDERGIATGLFETEEGLARLVALLAGETGEQIVERVVVHALILSNKTTKNKTFTRIDYRN